MIQALYHYYQKKVMRVETITNKVSCVICEDGRYALKKSRDTKIEWVCHYIQSLHLDAFVEVLLTVDHHYYFVYDEAYYYLMPWVDFEGEMVEELKLRNYFKRICQLHNETFFVSKIQEGYFAKEIEEIQGKLRERRQFYESLMLQSELCDYKAPWHWMMLELYPHIMVCLSRCESLLGQYETCVAEKKTCRLCFTYNHYDLAHYCFSKNLLVSLEGCRFNRPTGDIYAIYQNLADYYLDFENIENFYLAHFTLYQDEKLWLALHICLVPVFLMENNPLKMCWILERLYRYLEMAEKVTKRLGFS